MRLLREEYVCRLGRKNVFLICGEQKLHWFPKLYWLPDKCLLQALLQYHLAVSNITRLDRRTNTRQEHCRIAGTSTGFLHLWFSNSQKTITLTTHSPNFKNIFPLKTVKCVQCKVGQFVILKHENEVMAAQILLVIL